MKVCVIGAGYVGLVAAACLSKSGHQVLCIEKDAAKLTELQQGRIPIHEDGLEEIVQQGLTTGNLEFSSDFTITNDTEIVIIAVGTPSMIDGRVGLSQVYDVFQTIVEKVTHPLTVVMKSTVPPGLGDKIKEHYLNKAKAPIAYVSNPEFLREGQAVWDWYNPDRIVIGGDDRQSIDQVLQLYADIDAPKTVMNITSAEMVKYASNAFLATKISFINEIANLCELTGADILPVAEAVGMDNRIGGQFLKAGLGYGGSCFPKDTRGLDFVSTSYGHSFNLLKAVIEVNQRQRILAVRKLSEALGGLHGRNIGILGVAFKPNTDDTRESPALDIINLLLDEGAQVTAYDPVVTEIKFNQSTNQVKLTHDHWQAITGAEALVICTEWADITNIDWITVAQKMLPPKLILDGRNCLSKNQLTEMGFTYLGIGH